MDAIRIDFGIGLEGTQVPRYLIPTSSAYLPSRRSARRVLTARVLAAAKRALEADDDRRGRASGSPGLAGDIEPVAAGAGARPRALRAGALDRLRHAGSVSAGAHQ